MKSLYIAYQHIIFMLSISPEWQSAFKWTANACVAISAIIFSFFIDAAAGPLVFVGFFLGHILWALSGRAMRDIPLIALNVGFIPIDLWAMYIRL